MVRKITLFLKIVAILQKEHHILFNWIILPWVNVSYYVFLIIIHFQVELTSAPTYVNSPKVACVTFGQLTSQHNGKLDIDLPVKGSFAQCPSSNLTHQSLSMWKLIAFSFHSAEVCKSH